MTHVRAYGGDWLVKAQTDTQSPLLRMLHL